MASQHFDLQNARAVAVHRSHAWRGFSIEHVTPAQGDSFAYEWQSDLHFCALHDIVLKDGGIQAGDHREHNQRDLRDTLTYVPAGAKVKGWSELSDRQNSYVALYFDPRQLHEELDGRFRDDQKVRLYFRDPELGLHLKRFSTLLAQDGDIDDLYAETLGLMTVLTLQKANLGQLSPKPALPPRALARIVEYVDANLGGRIDLERLADLAGLSRFHFNRTFKAATGESPYQYVLARRMERAKELLVRRDMSVEQVALLVGFANASAFQKAFRARVGINPSDYARQFG